VRVRDTPPIYVEAKRHLRFLGKGSWAVMDQGLFASSNFVLNVLLARWLAPQEYGAFSVAYTVFWFFIILNTGLLTEPMLVFGLSRYKNRLSEYLGVLSYGNVVLAALGSILLLLTCMILSFSHQSRLSTTLLGLALAGPFILFQWLARRACYAYFKPHLAALGGAVYMAVVLVGIYVSHQRDLLSAPMAFCLMGLASIITVPLLAIPLRVRYTRLVGTGLIPDALKSHWHYGRWAVLSSVVATLTGTQGGGIYFFLVPIFGGLEAAAALKALLNLIMPMLHANVAIAAILVPALVRSRESADFARLMRLSMVLGLFGGILYWALLGLFHRQLITWLYGGNYMAYAGLAWLVGLVPLAAVVIGFMGAALNALERPDYVFRAYLISGLVALAIGPGCVAIWPVSGAIATIAVSSVAAAGALVWLFKVLRSGVDTDVEKRGLASGVQVHKGVDDL
jgi:O-antigen/teichoic acid export membrane protein